MCRIIYLLHKVTVLVAVGLMLTLLTGATLSWACQENAMLVFDASGSMASVRNGLPKVIVARDAAAEVLPHVTRNRPTGLITYGGAGGASCGDVQLRVPPMINSGDLILAELGLMQPNGQTPLSDAVLLATQTLKGLGQPGIIVLVTDGLENCGYNACAIGRQIATEAPNIRVHVIGFHLHSGAESRVACLAQQTSGTYVATKSLETLSRALYDRLNCPRISRLQPNDIPHYRYLNHAAFSRNQTKAMNGVRR